MGEIRKDNLHESLIEELNELANIDLSGKQDKTDESLLTESKDLVGAINELFQSANNGKELIANAIGEPVSKDDTFQAMSNDINSLLSTFKTNMMNNGITVDSGDKFKQLIDKIATMIEEGSGKGIYIESGIVTSDRNGGLTIPLQFEPIVVFTYQNETGTNGITYPTIYGKFDDNILSIRTYSSGGTTAASMITSRYTNGSFTTNTITGNMSCTYYAIGVGEEDTTLRDSLANILEEEGVTTTDEDDMASLIEKTDNEFQENTTILYNKMKDANYNVNSSMNMDALLNELNLKSKIEGSLSNQGIADESSITFTAKNLEFTPSLVYVTASGVTEQIDDEGNMRYYNTLIVTNKSVYTGASSNNTIKVNILNKGFEVKFTTYSTGYNSYLRWITINGVSYIAIR